MSAVPQVVIVRALFISFLMRRAETLKQTATAFVALGCTKCEAAELWRQGGLNAVQVGGRQWRRFWRYSRHGRRTVLLRAENREMVLVALNAASLPGRVQACTAPTIRRGLISLAPETSSADPARTMRLTGHQLTIDSRRPAHSRAAIPPHN